MLGKSRPGRDECGHLAKHETWHQAGASGKPSPDFRIIRSILADRESGGNITTSDLWVEGSFLVEQGI